ncbi:MAG: hypothetical protein BWY90_01241 [Deltaproteobacteria bacterium ADurb.BinA014]|nr:MAG: hypothetical protein BWY90_01241 [Deltaproteobacteria bacterium ADurb.BinA014]
MTAFFNSRGVDAIIACLFRVHRVTHRAYFVKHLYACSFQFFNKFHPHRFIQRRAGNFHSRDFFLGAHAQIHFVMFRRDVHGRKNRHVNHKRLVRKFSRFLNRNAEFLFRGIITGGKIAHTTRVGYRRAKFRLAEPHHGAAHNRVFHPKHFRNRCLHFSPQNIYNVFQPDIVREAAPSDIGSSPVSKISIISLYRRFFNSPKIPRLFLNVLAKANAFIIRSA